MRVQPVVERKRGMAMSGSVVRGIFDVCLFTSQRFGKQTGSGPSYKLQGLLPESHFLYLEILSEDQEHQLGPK